jgi:hypothetical protein
VKTKKNPAAVSLAKLRAKKLGPTRRKEIAEKASAAATLAMTQEQRKQRAKKAAAARWGKRNS